MKPSGYGDLQALHDGARTTILRARRADDDRVVVLKQLRAPFPSRAELARLRREYDLTRLAAGPGVIPMHGLIARDGSAWIEMEEAEGSLLALLAARKVLPIKEVLVLALGVVDALDGVHRRGVIHKDLNPSNVLLGREGGVRLIDFGIAATMTVQVPLRADRLEGTPSYMSPEQTGRMNRAIDWRSDYYSLGATLYHLVTGAPPFQGDDPIETAYAHIARRPAAPREVSAAVPEAVSDLIMTLLAKRADDRYQSAAGLRHDLGRCLDDLRGGGEARSFPLRGEDRPETLRIPDTLYGRAAEIEALDAALGRVAGGASEAYFVTGPAGTGKTSLVGEIHRGVAKHRAVLIAGKFEQFQRDVPYACVLRALRQFIHQLLGLAPAEIEVWRARLVAALGDTGAVLRESLPELELLVGELRAPPEVSPIEAENRFLGTLVRLVAALAVAGSPAVILLDDLQWADAASLVLLEKLLIEPGLRRVLVLGTWRSNEVDASHPLARGLGRARDLGARVAVAGLGPLSAEEVGRLLAETLGCPPGEVAALAQLGHVWTEGNPFLLHRLVEKLRDDALLRREEGRWSWDLAEIARRGLGEDGAGFVAGRLAELPPATRRALEVASCVGTSFRASVLAHALDCPRGEVRTSLAPALALRLVHPLHQEWWPDAADDVDFEFAFSHDRIQEAAHARLREDETRPIHLRIGRQLRQRPEEDVFDVVHHLNIAVALLSEEEREELLRLDAEAGRRALRSGAFAPALHLLEQASALITPDAWTRDRPETFRLLLDTARASYLAGESARLEVHLGEVLRRAESPIERAAALEIRALDRAGRDLLGAVDVALEAMAELGVRLPRRPEMSDVQAAVGAAVQAIEGLGVGGVVALAELGDARTAAVVELASTIMAPAYLAAPLLLPVLAAEVVSQTTARGVTPQATYGYAVLALVLTAGGALEPGHQLARLCLRLMERFHGRGGEVRPAHVVMGHVLPFTLPLREAVAGHQTYLPRALAAGDHEYAMWIAHLSLANAFYAGLPLDELAADLDREAHAMRRLGQRAPLDCTEPYRRLLRSLRGPSWRPARMDEEGSSEEAAFEALVASGSRGAVYILQTLRLLLRFTLRDLAGALEAADAGEPYEDGAAVTYHLIVFRQTLALVCAALAGEQASAAARAALLDRARANRALLAAPAAHAPHNHLHRVHLIDAELARVEGDALAAIDHYDAAIAAARENGFTHEEALANELAGRFYLARRRLTPARAYLLEACGAWARWGATAKLCQLEDELPDLVIRSGPASSRAVTVDVTGMELDLATLSKTTLAITSEIRTDHLVERVLEVSIENAGATRGLLLLDREGTLRLEASQGDGFPPRGTPLGQLTGVPLSVLQYVVRTSARLVLPDARLDPRFASDPALPPGRPLSVLALPLILQGRSSGLLYLENDLTADAFPAGRTQLLEMLGAQAAISLENARLYGEAEALTRRLQARVRDRSRELAAVLRRLSDGNGGHALLALGTVLSEQVRIVGVLGAGGMGVVYAGEDLRTGERVAVKAVLGSLLRSDSAALQRFLRESHAAASVSHPAVARTLAVDVSGDGLIFQVQELVDGEPLKQALEAQRTLLGGETARLGAVLAAALAEAHKAGVVHRDIKPSNIMLTATEPGLKLLDFGIARLTTDVDEQADSEVIGTPDYMAPEQLLDPERVGVAVDVYALGLVLYRALAGYLPVGRVDLAQRVVFDPPPLPAATSRTSPELVRLIVACLARDPADRPASTQLATDLAAIANRARIASLPTLSARWITALRRHPLPASHGGPAVTLTQPDADPDEPDA